MDKGIVDKNILYGSWAGAFGNFQFMPRTIRNYAIDFNKNKIIELKTEDSCISSKLFKTHWMEKDEPCFFKIDLNNKIPEKYLNSSARKIDNKKNVSFFKNYIKDFQNLNLKKKT